MTGALAVQDYDLNIQSLPEKRKVIYDYNFRDNLNLNGKNINIDLLNGNLSDINGNALQPHRWTFLADPENSMFTNPSITSPLLGAAVAVGAGNLINEAIHRNNVPRDTADNPFNRKEHDNTSIQHSFKIWAIFAFLFFLISMVAGIIGMCCCYCPHLQGRNTDFWDFFYQKLL